MENYLSEIMMEKKVYKYVLFLHITHYHHLTVCSEFFLLLIASVLTQGDKHGQSSVVQICFNLSFAHSCTVRTQNILPKRKEPFIDTINDLFWNPWAGHSFSVSKKKKSVCFFRQYIQRKESIKVLSDTASPFPNTLSTLISSSVRF